MTSSRFVPVTPVRAADTRKTSIIAGRSERRMKVLGWGAVPTAGVTSVMLNITATGTSGPGYLSVWGGGERPATSNINFAAGDTIAASAISAVTEAGEVVCFNGSTLPAHVVVDVMGYFTTDEGSGYQALQPTRLLDTRSAAGPVSGGGSVTVQVAGEADVPPGAMGALVNITVTEPNAWSYVRAYPSDGAVPDTSVINYFPGQTRANLAAVKLGAGGGFDLAVHQGDVQIIVDLLGYFDESAANAYTPIAPVRAYDSREYAGGDALHPNEVVDLPMHQLPGVPAQARAVAANVTVVQPSAPTFIATYPAGQAPPEVSTVNTAPHPSWPGFAICNNSFITLDDYGYASVRNRNGRAHVVVDVVGYLS